MVSTRVGEDGLRYCQENNRPQVREPSCSPEAKAAGRGCNENAISNICVQRLAVFGSRSLMARLNEPNWQLVARATVGSLVQHGRRAAIPKRSDRELRGERRRCG